MRGALAGVAGANVAVTLAATAIHAAKFYGEGFVASSPLIFAAIGHLHYVSSGWSLAVAATGLDVGLMRACMAMAVYVFLVDVHVILARGALGVTVTDWFRVVMWVISGAWLALTLAEIVLLAVLAKTTTAPRYREKEDARHQTFSLPGRHGHGDSDHNVKHLYALPRKVRRARKALSATWPVELVLAILFLACFAPGFVTTNRVGVVLATLHLVQWAWVRAVIGPVAGTPPEPGVTDPKSPALGIALAGAGILLVFDCISLLLHIFNVLVTSTTLSAPWLIAVIGEPVTLAFAVFSLAIVFAFVVVDAVEVGLLQALAQGLREHALKIR